MVELLWNRMTAETLRERAAQGAIVLLPVASTEQHGPHLATGVDDYLCSEACRRAAALVAKERPIVVAPTVWCGLAEHHVAFGGTFTLSLSTYQALLRDLCQSILRAGFKQILIVNGHGGNIAALNAFTTELTRELGAPIATTTYIMGGAEATKAILEDQDAIQHACEGETSMMMAVKPDLVDHARLPEAHGASLDLGGALARPIHVWKSFRELTPSGVMGNARRATPAKGEAILDACAKGIAERLLKGEPWA
jgi:creatinine amidohydrolase